ncbi:unnamed protein product, partial [Laminaria digitata]
DAPTTIEVQNIDGVDGCYDISGACEVTLTVDFLNSMAGYNNSFGYYIAGADGNPVSGGVVWSNVKTGGDGVGDEVTITLDAEALEGGEKLGFFIIPNGSNLNPGLADGDDVTFTESGGDWSILQDGSPLSGRGADVLFSDNTHNPGGFDQENDAAPDGNMNWEDIVNGGDGDYNDVNLNVTVEGSYFTSQFTDGANVTPTVIFSSSFEVIPDDAQEISDSFFADAVDGWTKTAEKIEIWTDDAVRDQGAHPDGTDAAADGSNFIELNHVSSDAFADADGIYRDVDTEAGQVYELTFNYSGRPGYDATVNKMGVSVDGVELGDYAHDMSGSTDHDWQTVTVSFVGTGAPMRIQFEETSNNDDPHGRGMSLDQIELVDTGRAVGGDDYIDGGSGNDILDGNGGADVVYGNDGDDIGEFVVGEDGGLDSYDGGTGTDALRVFLTSEQYADADIQSDLVALQAFIDANSDPLTDSGASMTFDHLDIEVEDWEELEIYVDGKLVDEDDPNNLADAVDDTADVSEDGPGVTIDVLNNDDVPDGVSSVTIVTPPGQGNATVNPDNSIAYDPNGDFDHLGEGETATVTFTYEVEDTDGDTDIATVTVTVTGTNDDPTVSVVGTDDSGSVTELTDADAGENVDDLSATGTITFDDADLSDGHTVSSAPNGAGYLGTFGAVVSTAATGAGAGEIDWTFTVND